MPIPDYQTVVLPLLRFAGDQQEHSLRRAVDTIFDQFNLTKQERQALLQMVSFQFFITEWGGPRPS